MREREEILEALNEADTTERAADITVDFVMHVLAEADALQKLNSCGVCYTPAEVAAREAAAFKRGQEAMREKAANHVRRLLLPDDCGPDEAHGRFQQAIASCEAIRALPVEEMPTHHVEVKRVADLTDAEAESLFGADNDEG